MKHFLARFLRKLGILNRFNLIDTVNFNGRDIKVPIINGIGFGNLNSHEPWMMDILMELTKARKGVFMDIGVNIGQTLMKIKSLDESIRYIGFEPNPLCVFYANDLVRVNKFENVTIIPAGIFNRNDILKLNFNNSDATDSSASLIENFRPDTPVFDTHYVPVVDISVIFSKLDIDAISIIKIDVEGAELEVLESLRPIIIVYKPTLLLEILPVYSEDNIMRKERQEKIEKLVSEMEYMFHRILRTPDDHYRGLQQIDSIGIHSDMSQCDYVLTPLEQS